MYIPGFVLKPIAAVLKAFFSLIMPKWAKHGQRRLPIPVKATIIALARALGLTYRDAVLLAVDLADVLGIEDVTTFQNLHAFAKRLRPEAIQDLIRLSGLLIVEIKGVGRLEIAVDSTGLRITDSSSWYDHRVQRAADFFKLHVAMDLATKAIVLATATDRYCHDLTPMREYFLAELEALAEDGYRIEFVSADSAYASEDVYRRLEAIGAYPGIKPRRAKRGLHGRYYRRRCSEAFRRIANRRWLLEAAFKSMKRLFGERIRARRPEERAKEALFKALVWNAALMAVLAMEAMGAG